MKLDCPNYLELGSLKGPDPVKGMEVRGTLQ